jgi:nucleotide-binding universal stress UspA family protein
MISKVLVAVDGSENSERALVFALDFADKYSAALTLMTVNAALYLSAKSKAKSSALSENSERALDFALDFADKYSAALTVINVTESSAFASVPSDMSAFSGDSSMIVMARDLRRFHEDLLEKALARAKNAKPNVPVSSSLREGNPASEIVSAAKMGGFDVVVVGHRGVGKVREIFLGSISEKVTHLLTCTVIIVR